MTQECIFCTERIFKAGETPVALCCGHVFHERCIRTWFTSKKHCPTCKQNRQQALAKTTDGVIKLFLDGVPGSSPTKAGEGGAVDLTGDEGEGDNGTASTSEVLLLRHSLLHAQRALTQKEHEMEMVRSSHGDLQEALRIEEGKVRRLQTQIQAATASVRAAENEARSRENQLRDIRQKMAAEQEIVREARSLKATVDAHVLNDQGEHEQAVDRLDAYCSREDLVVHFKRMMQHRHERCVKMEEKTREMQREIAALRKADEQRHKREEQLIAAANGRRLLEADNKLLRQKLNKARASALDVKPAPEGAGGEGEAGAWAAAPGGQAAVAAATWAHPEVDSTARLSRSERGPSVRTTSEASAGTPGGAGAERNLVADSVTPPTVCKGVSGFGAAVGWAAGESSLAQTTGQVPAAGRGKSGLVRKHGLGSMIGGARGSSLLSIKSNDSDDGGRYIRSGPDGMGGTVHVCVQAAQTAAASRSSGVTTERPLKPISHRSIAVNRAGLAPGTQSSCIKTGAKQRDAGAGAGARISGRAGDKRAAPVSAPVGGTGSSKHAKLAGDVGKARASSTIASYFGAQAKPVPALATLLPVQTEGDGFR